MPRRDRVPRLYSARRASAGQAIAQRSSASHRDPRRPGGAQGAARGDAAGAGGAAAARARAGAPAHRAAGHPHRRSDHRRRHRGRLFRVRRPNRQRQRALAVRDRAGRRRRGRKYQRRLAARAVRLRLAAPPAGDRPGDRRRARPRARRRLPRRPRPAGAGRRLGAARRRAPHARLVVAIAGPAFGGRPRLLHALHAIARRPPCRAGAAPRRRPDGRGSADRRGRARRIRAVRGRRRRPPALRHRCARRRDRRADPARRRPRRPQPADPHRPPARPPAASSRLRRARHPAAAAGAERDRPDDADAAHVPARRRNARPVQRHGRDGPRARRHHPRLRRRAGAAGDQRALRRLSAARGGGYDRGGRFRRSPAAGLLRARARRLPRLRAFVRHPSPRRQLWRARGRPRECPRGVALDGGALDPRHRRHLVLPLRCRSRARPLARRRDLGRAERGHRRARRGRGGLASRPLT